MFRTFCRPYTYKVIEHLKGFNESWMEVGTGQSVTVSVAFLDVKLQNLVNQVADFTLIRRKLNVGAEICRTIGGPNSSEDKFRRFFIPPSMQTGLRFLAQNLIHNTILSIKTSSTFLKCKDFI